MKKAIVTGANGFVGSNVCKKLCENGVEVTAVIKDENENIDNIKSLSKLSVVYCDLDSIESLTEKISGGDYDVFYHFAWVGSAGPLRCDEEIQLKNALWTAKALRTACKLGCKKFVNAGSIMEKETYTAVYTQDSTPGLPYIYGAGKLAARFWPGALTLVVRASDAVPAEYRAPDGTVALRCPNSDLVRKIARVVDMPLAVTSANTHGHSAPAKSGQLEVRIVDEVDLTLDGGPAPLGVASTIVGCLGDAPTILREGAIPTSEILQLG